MRKTIQIYDDDVEALLKIIDEKCRDFDGAKYGIPKKGTLRESILKNIVYGWCLDNEYEKETK